LAESWGFIYGFCASKKGREIVCRSGGASEASFKNFLRREKGERESKRSLGVKVGFRVASERT
jgi:hypothetical protein